MRIALVVSDYAPTVGGVQTAVQKIAHHAARLGHAVTILTSQPPGMPAIERVDDIIVHRFPWGHRPTWSLPFRAAWTLVGIARVLHEFKPDVVNVHFLSINALWVLLLRYVWKFPLILSAHGNDIQGMPLHSRGQRWMLARLFARADAISFCSSYVQRDAAPYLKHASPRAFVGVVGDGFDPEDFENTTAFKNDTPYLLGVGRLVHKKGFDLLIRAFAKISHEFPQFQLLIAGDGEERAALERLIDELPRSVRGRIVLLGFADRAKTIALFCGCEFFVLSSRLEPFGIVVLEAMAAHKAVLATKSGGVIDLMQPGINGWLIEANDPDALARGIREMLANPDATRALGERAYATIDRHTWAAVTRQFIEIFERVLNA